MTARLDSNLATAQAGDFTASANEIVICDDGSPKRGIACPAASPVQFIEHSFPNGSQVSTLPYSFTWTPPATNVGPVHFYVAGTAVNGDLKADANDHVYTASYVLTPQGPPAPNLIITTATLPSGTVLQPYSQQLFATGGTPPYTWSLVSGSFPTGLALTLSTGILGGTPTRFGSYSFTVQARDSNGATASKAFSMTISPGVLFITSQWLNSGYVGVLYSQTLHAAGGAPPYSWAITGLPAGLTFDTSRAIISGTPLVAGTYSVIVRVSDTMGEAVATVFTFNVGYPPPSINVGGVVNSASYTAGDPVAPGSIASVFGSFPLSSSITAPGAPLPTNLAGVSFKFGSVPAPLFFISSGQAGIQVPWELAGQSTASITVSQSAPQTVRLRTFAPAIFSMNASGTGQGAILNAQYQLVDSSHPAEPGDVIQIYCTGLGPVTNQPATGAAALSDRLSMTTAMPSVTIGGVQAEVLFSGLTPGAEGLYQVNARVPVVTENVVPVTLSIGGVASNTVTMPVQIPPLPGFLSPGGSTLPLAPTINSITPTLLWGAIPGATGYAVVLTNVSTGEVILNQNVTTNSIKTPPLARGANYVWTVAAYTSWGRSAMSPPSYFTVWQGYTGNWTGLWTSSAYSAGGAINANLSQTGSTLRGTVSFSGSPCFTGGTVYGTVDEGGTATVTIAVGGGQTISATLVPPGFTEPGVSMHGSYFVQGSTCANGDYGTIWLN
jgi:uncharacterized protein (TIGR03437 family)